MPVLKLVCSNRQTHGHWELIINYFFLIPGKIFWNFWNFKTIRQQSMLEWKKFRYVIFKRIFRYLFESFLYINFFFQFNFRSIQFRNCRRWPRSFITKSWISTQEHPFGAKFAQTTNWWIKAYHIATQISTYRTRCWVVEWGK